MTSASSGAIDAPGVIGIVGGLGPHAHIELERLLLAAMAQRLGRPPTDQDYPEWIVSSIPSTPDRTRALLEHGPSPVPALRRSLERLATAGADFGIIPCNTAHAFIDELREGSPIPIVDMIDAALVRAVALAPAPARIGLLATTGTCRARLYHDRAARLAGVELVSLLDLPGGDALQEALVMTPIYGPLRPGGPAHAGGPRIPGGIKAGMMSPQITAALREAVQHLADAGAALVICGCTELPLALGREPSQGTPLLDPMQALATRALELAFGDEAPGLRPSPPRR